MKRYKQLEKLILLAGIFIVMFHHFSCEPMLNQLTAYPDTYVAPTMAEYVQKTNYTNPLLSRVLYELDYSKKLRKHDFIGMIKYSLYEMTHGEVEQIFLFADINHDDLLDSSEWDSFVANYILPFEACDKSRMWLLNVAEFAECFDADPQTLSLAFRNKYEVTKYDVMVAIVQTRGKPMINFADYLLIRRAVYSWKECHNHLAYMAVRPFHCALKLAMPLKYQLKIDIDDIYQIGIKLSNEESLIQLDFVGYLRIMYFTYIFSILGSPQSIPIIEKTQFIKSIKEDRFPNNFELKEVEFWYDLTLGRDSQLSFASFCFFFNLHKLFNKYSLTRPLYLNKGEVYKLLNDPLAPVLITLAIDKAYSNFSEAEYLEASLSLQRLRSSERSFYYRFKEKQDASEVTSFFFNKTQLNIGSYLIKPNKQSREIFFQIFTESGKGFWGKEGYYRAFVLSNIFIQLCGNDNRRIIPASTLVDKLPMFYETVVPTVALKYRTSYFYYKALPRELFVDILSFLAIEMYSLKMAFQMNSSRNSLIDETQLKIIMKDIGMYNVPDTVIDLTRKGYDSMRRRLYDPIQTFKNLMLLQALASEQKRTQDTIQKYKLRINEHPERKYPPFNRRFMSSPMV